LKRALLVQPGDSIEKQDSILRRMKDPFSHRIGDTVKDIVTKNWCEVMEIDDGKGRVKLHQSVIRESFWRDMADVSEPFDKIIKNGGAAWRPRSEIIQ